MNGWGNSYDIEPSKETAPLDLDVNYEMRCEYPHWVAPTCLCPDQNPPEGGARRCSFIHEYGLWMDKRRREWGKKIYSSPEYCWKLNTIIDRPLGTVCSEHAHCAVGRQCSDGVCSTCPNFECPDRTPSDALLGWGKTCKYGEYECPNNNCAQEGEGCSPTNLGLGCCEGLKCSFQGRWIEDKCKVDGDCTEDDDDICQSYFCLKNKVVNGEGHECFVDDNGISSNCSISGFFCDVESNTCYRSYDKPTPICNHYLSKCMEHFECDVGLYCNGGRCRACPVVEECPNKGERKPNFPVCKYGQYECPGHCLVGMEECNSTRDECCLGLKCQKLKHYPGRQIYYCTVNHLCKKTGTCNDGDDDICDNYGCFNGKVAYAVGQEYYSENGQASVNCTGGTICDTDTNKCYISNEAPRIIYNYAGKEDCKFDYDCDKGLYCTISQQRWRKMFSMPCG